MMQMCPLFENFPITFQIIFNPVPSYGGEGWLTTSKYVINKYSFLKNFFERLQGGYD